MKLESLHIKHFRACEDITINFNDYTCLVGPNGTGKSTVLMALNILFRNTSGPVTDVLNLNKEDFYNKDTGKPILITATFGSLEPNAVEDLRHYVRQGKLIIKAIAEWDASTNSASVKQLGVRNVMRDFAPFFEASENGSLVAELRDIYSKIRNKYPDLIDTSTKANMEKALREYEENHPEFCELIDSQDQFYGYTKGSNLLSKYIKWVYIPAVKDASVEQDETRNTALGELLQRTVRIKVKFDDSLKGLQDQAEKRYLEIIDNQQHVLDEISGSLQDKLQEWAHPGAQVKVKWNFDPSKSIKVADPMAKADIGEDGFIGEVARMGHGIQRAFIVSILQELATCEQEIEPTLILGFEEPELYQHPPQARHLAKILEDLKNAQVIISTHSPYFVSGKEFESVRMMRKHRTGKVKVTQATLEKLSQRLALALGEEPVHPSSLVATIEQIMQPSLRELFFCNMPILVEGIEDVAFISTYIELTKKSTNFRKIGGHFIVCSGKTNMSRPLAIALELGIPYFIMFDADSTNKKNDNKRDNKCILNLCSISNINPLSIKDVWKENVVMWGTKIRDVVRSEIGPNIWDEAQQEMIRYNYQDISNKQKNSLLISATLEHLFHNSKNSNSLEKLCNHILHYGQSLI
jgi:putative ATP-dependent endonuclease of OLD family